MKKILWLLPILALFLMGGSDPVELIRFTIINKSESDIAIQLNAIPKVCCNKADTVTGEFYYLPVAEGSKEVPTVKIYTLAKDTYQMHLFYISTYDPVYGFKCEPTVPNVLNASRDLRLTVLPCNRATDRHDHHYLGARCRMAGEWANPACGSTYLSRSNNLPGSLTITGKTAIFIDLNVPKIEPARICFYPIRADLLSQKRTIYRPPHSGKICHYC